MSALETIYGPQVISLLTIPRWFCRVYLYYSCLFFYFDFACNLCFWLMLVPVMVNLLVKSLFSCSLILMVYSCTVICFSAWCLHWDFKFNCFGGPRGRVVKVADFSALDHSIISPMWGRASHGARIHM